MTIEKVGKTIAMVLVLALMGCALVLAVNAIDNAHKEPIEMKDSRFEEIDCNVYYADGVKVTERMVYEKETKVVYVMLLSRDSVSITPYIMRDMIGQMTVGLYDDIACVIYPAEIYFDEDETWFVIS